MFRQYVRMASLAILAAALIAGSLEGQEPRPAPPSSPAAVPAGLPGFLKIFRPSPVHLLKLLRLQQVQQELTLTNDQVTSIKGIARTTFAALQAGNTAPADAAATLKTNLSGVLQAAQMTRLMQIHVWALGSAAFADADVMAALQLSSDQQTSLAQIDANMVQALTNLGWPVATTQTWAQQWTQQLTTIQQNAMTQALAVLPPAQQTTFQRLQGAAFTLTLNMPPPLPPPPPPRQTPSSGGTTNSGGTTGSGGTN